MSWSDWPSSATGRAEAALALARCDTAEEAFDELADVAEAALRTGRLREAARTIAALREIQLAVDNAPRVAVLANLEGHLHGVQGRQREADEAYRRAEWAAREAGDEHLASTTLMNRGVVASDAGDLVRAVPLFAESARHKLLAGDDYGATQAMLNLAAALLERNDVEQAEELINAIEAAVRSFADPHLLSTLVGTRARIALGRGDFTAAMRLNQEALRHARRSGDAGAVAVSLQNLAGATANAGDVGGALRWYRKALAVAEGTGSTPRVEAVLRGLAVALAGAGRLPESAEAFERARRLSLELGDRRTWATSTADMGAVHLRLGELDAARALLQEALAELERLGDAEWQVRVLENLAEVTLRVDGAPAAAELLERALRLAPDAERRADLWGRTGDAWTSVGSYGRAVAAYRRRLEERSGAIEGLALAWETASIGRVLDEVGASGQAIEFYERALALAGGDDQVAFHVGNDRGIALAALGELEDAQDQFAGGLVLARRLQDRAMEAIAAMNAGETARRLGDLQQGEELTRRAALLGQQLGDSAVEAQALHLLGLSLAGQGRWPEAEEAHTAAIDVARAGGERKTEADATGALADAALHDGRPEEAVRLYRRALRIGRDRQRVQWTEHLAGLVEALSALGRRADVRREAQRLVDVAQRTGREEFASEALVRAAHAWLDRGRTEDAVGLFALAILLVAGGAVRGSAAQGSGEAAPKRDELDQEAIRSLLMPVFWLVLAARRLSERDGEVFVSAVLDAVADYGLSRSFVENMVRDASEALEARQPEDQ